MDQFKEKQVKRRLVYDIDFITIYEDDILLPNNKPSKRVVVDHVGAACVLPLTKNHEVVLVKQYRYAIDAVSLEIPTGKKDFKGEDSKACAKRELEEEVAYTSDDFEWVSSMYSAIGYSNELIDIYLAKDCVPYDGVNQPDDDEFLERVFLSIDQAKAFVKDGTIKDAKTVITILQL